MVRKKLILGLVFSAFATAVAFGIYNINKNQKLLNMKKSVATAAQKFLIDNNIDVTSPITLSTSFLSKIGYLTGLDESYLQNSYVVVDNKNILTTLNNAAVNYNEDDDAFIEKIVVTSIKSTYDMTKENVLVTLKISESVLPIENGWVSSLDNTEFTKLFTGNTTETVNLVSAANSDKKLNYIVSVTNIDRDAPIVSVNYSNKEKTINDVKVTINSNEPLKNIDGWNLDNSGLSISKIYSSNIDEKIILSDIAGNTTGVDLKISNIDKEFNKPVVNYSPNTITNKDVLVTIVVDEEIQQLDGWILSSDKKTLSKKYSENKLEKLTIKDIVGNSQIVDINVSKIDKEGPNITLNGSSYVQIKYGTNYTELGAEAVDNNDGKVNVSVVGTIDPYKLGLQTISYKSADSLGNETQIDRTVEVIAVNPSEIVVLNNNCVNDSVCYNVNNLNNYVWYSGYLWRIISSNNGMVKLITEDSIAGFPYDSSSSNFSGSIIEQWLKEKFYPSLNNNSRIVVQSEYCNQMAKSSFDKRTTCSSEGSFNSLVGLLTIDEYNILGAENSFLNTGDQFFTMTKTSDHTVWVIDYNGIRQPGYRVNQNPFGIRPVITISNSIKIVSGNGTKNNPYRLDYDLKGTKNEKLNSRYPGEYVEFANEKWRIVGTESVTKIVLDSLYKENSSVVKLPFETVNNFNLETGIGYYLNNKVYNMFNTQEKNAMSKFNLYNSEFRLGYNPLNTSLTNSGNNIQVYVGLNSVGELMSGSISTSKPKGITAWLINYNGSLNQWYTSTGGTSSYSPATNIRGIKPLIALKDYVTIKSGEGTYEKPYLLNY